MQPPQHNSGGPCIWAPADDETWDWDRINKEFDEKPKDDPEWEHPVWWYLRADTAWDLHAETDPAPPADYLKENAERWSFRPLKRLEYEQISNIVARGLSGSAKSKAFEMGVLAVDGLPIDLYGPTTELGYLTIADMDRVHEIKPQRIYEVGDAIIAASSGRLTPAEKKP